MDKDILIKDIPVGMFHGKTVLLTGATGLIGTHFLYAFAEMRLRGVDVNVIALGTRFPPKHLESLLQQSFVKYSICDLSTMDVKPYFNGVDIIIHAATYGQPQKFMDNPISTIKLNTSVVVDLIEKVKNGRFLFVSSSEIYSGLDVDPFTEEVTGTTNPGHPRACYIESKRCGEAIVNVYRNMGVDAKSVRLCLAYGEGIRKDDQRALNVFIKQALLGGRIELKDRGQAIRTYIYVADAVNMMLRVLTEGRQAVYNIGGDISINILGLACMIGGLIDSPVTTSTDSCGSEGAPPVVRMSIQRYVDEFGKREFVSLEEGLKKTIQYQKTLYDK
jgi:nucleoside-diphosphate-sugar epimerase